MYKEFTISEVSEEFGITKQAVSQYIKKGKLDAFKVGNSYRITGTAIEKFLEQSNKKYIGGAY